MHCLHEGSPLQRLVKLAGAQISFASRAPKPRDIAINRHEVSANVLPGSAQLKRSGVFVAFGT
jgi:hypothetical protein